MSKYLSCPICGEPEPEVLKEEPTQAGNHAWQIHCFGCGCIVNIIIVQGGL
jgi:uncharacterized Zn finger protein